MSKIKEFLFPEKTKWVDIGNFENGGNYYLLQMRTTIKTNKKEFRRAKMGFVNDYPAKSNLYANSLLQLIPTNELSSI